MQKSLTLIAALLLNSCASTQPESANQIRFEPLTSMYSYQILDSRRGTAINIDGIAAQLAQANAVFIGEFHSHHGSHLLQLELLQALYRIKPNLVLSMEQFTRDHQDILDRYLAGSYGEQTLIEEGDAWPDYKGSYRPLVEFAREHNIPIVAANAPAMHVRCVECHRENRLYR